MQTDGRTEKHAEANSLFRNFVNAHENLSSYHTENTMFLHYKDQLIFRTKKIYSPYDMPNVLCEKKKRVFLS
jgi:hypothetical protein